MTDPAPSIPPPADDPQGSLGAVLIGGAILLIAGLFIFWPQSDTTTTATRTAAGQSAAQGSNSLVSGKDGGDGGIVRGIDPRDIDPAQAAQRVQARLTAGVQAPNLQMAPAPTPAPEPTSFDSTAEEIAYVEKKLTLARADVEARAVFVDRMQKILQKGKTADEDERNAARAKIVQQNYETARARVTELEARLKSLKQIDL